MKKTLVVFILAFGALALVVAGCGEQSESGSMDKQMDDKMDAEPASAKVQEAMVGEAAPDFTLTSAKGKKYTLSDYEGKFVVLEWINFECPFVKKHYGVGNMQTLQEMYTQKDVVWLTICSSAPGKQGNFAGDELMSRISNQKMMSTAYLVDADGSVGRMYGAKTTPHMFVIDPSGKLIYAGAIDDKPTANPDDVPGATNYVVAALDAAMGGKEVPTRTSQPYGCSVKY